jgi:hypothetical protein
MKKIFLLFFFVLGFYYSGFTQFTTTQTITIDSNSLFQFLFNYPHKISLFSRTYISPLEFKEGTASVKIIKNELGLYLLINGTGRVYKAVSLQNNRVNFQRIDSTINFGFNFSSIDFSFNNDIYSYGGYGYWNINGQLRIYTAHHEWSIVKLDKELDVLDNLNYYSEEKSRLYFVEAPHVIESTNSKTTEYNAIVLNLDKLENKNLGQINRKINISNAKIICSLTHLNGSLICIDYDFYIIDYENNKIYKLINKKLNKLFFSMLNNNFNTFFSIDNKIYFYNKPKNILSSISISKSDFKPEPYPLYKKAIDYELIKYAFLITILGFIILLYAYKKIHRNKVKNNQILEPDKSSNEFTNIEITIIKSLIIVSENNGYLNVSEINEILGIKKKAIEIQKRVRSETINRINHKFNIEYNQKTVLIERIKSKEDARFYNYFINSSNIKIYRG